MIIIVNGIRNLNLIIKKINLRHFLTPIEGKILIYFFAQVIHFCKEKDIVRT